VTRVRYDEWRCISACEHIARRIVRPLVGRYLEAGDFLGTEVKADRSLATAADLAIEREVRAFLAHEFPDYGVYGEELGASGRP
jgi:fructose-1,6-bisphosphatase/inositol monophosphatase family enzyme